MLSNYPQLVVLVEVFHHPCPSNVCTHKNKPVGKSTFFSHTIPFPDINTLILLQIHCFWSYFCSVMHLAGPKAQNILVEVCQMASRACELGPDSDNPLPIAARSMTEASSSRQPRQKKIPKDQVSDPIALFYGFWRLDSHAALCCFQCRPM